MHAAANCANCDAPLTGPYCAQCGQHAHESSRSVGALFHDAWHAVSHVDARFWQTLAALLLRPGQLTRDYFAERRARYLPPVRLYLVLSVLCFALLALGVSANEQAAGAVKTLPAGPGAASKVVYFRAGTPFDPATCKSIEVEEWPRLEASLRAACVRIAPDGGMALMHAFVTAIPKTMFVFLPVMALVMLLLYWRPRHYYVEHLVFFLHAHAAVFLILILNLLLSRLARAVPALGWLSSLVNLASTLYVIWYIYRAMRVYYAQGRWRTLGKLAAVGIAYFAFLQFTLVTTMALVAAFAS